MSGSDQLMLGFWACLGVVLLALAAAMYVILRKW
jgi:hypothetical protein